MSAIHVTFIKHHWIKLPLNQRLRSWECMEACTKAVGAGWTSGGTIDRWDLSPPSRRLVYCHSVWLATLGTSDASLWAHESMGLHLPPLGESTNEIQGWGIVLGCFPRSCHLGRAWWAHRGSSDLPMEGPPAHFPPIIIPYINILLGTSGTRY